MVSECCNAPVQQTWDEVVLKMMTSCTKCKKACTIKIMQPSTPMPAPMNFRAGIPIYRAVDLAQKKVVEGALSTKNLFIATNQDPIIPTSIAIDLFTGRIAEDGTPVYSHDKVEVGTLNEFGSVAVDTGVVLYSTEHMAFLITSAHHSDGVDAPLPTKIFRVIGRYYEG